MFAYDLDFPKTWVPRFQDILYPSMMQIVDEIERQTDWDRSGSDIHMTEPKPPAPARDAALRKIAQDLNRNSFRAFHATRLVRPEIILTEGLQILDQSEHVDRVLREYQGLQSDRAEQVIKALSAWQENHHAVKEGLRRQYCWLVPHRHLLHDKGLNEMFQHLGGEFIQDIITEHVKSEFEDKFEPGRATVVVAILPGQACSQTQEFGPMKILAETMASAGHFICETMSPPWNVKVRSNIPPENIEYVCDKTDRRVAKHLFPDADCPVFDLLR